jgi:hypothetical protein
MEAFYFQIHFSVLNKGIPEENGMMVWKSNQPDPRNEIKNHLKEIKFGKGFGIGKEILIQQLKSITEEEYNFINHQIVTGQ